MFKVEKIKDNYYKITTDQEPTELFLERIMKSCLPENATITHADLIAGKWLIYVTAFV